MQQQRQALKNTPVSSGWMVAVVELTLHSLAGKLEAVHTHHGRNPLPRD